MFDYVSGRIAAVGENKVVIDVGGVGFAVTVSANACAACSQKTEIKMPVYLAVREDALELFGFSGEEERSLFLQLINVSGVGPKLAVAVLGGMATDRLCAAIAGGDATALSTIKGVGKKTAERIVLELKGKIESDVVLPSVPPSVIAYGDEAINALIALGYDRKEAESALRRVATPDMNTEQLIRAVLRG